MNNDDKFIRDLNDSQDFDERLTELLANPGSSGDELAQLIGAVQDIQPPADFVAQLDAQLQARVARLRNVSRVLRYSVAVAAAVLVFVMVIVPFYGRLVPAGVAEYTSVADEPTATPQLEATNLAIATQVAVEFTATPVETAMAALSTATPFPSDTSTALATRTPTTSPTTTPLPSPTPEFEATSLPMTATLALSATAQTVGTEAMTATPAGGIVLSTPMSLPTQGRATQTINLTRIIDDNAAFDDYIDYRATVDDVAGLDVEPRFIIQVNSAQGTPVPGAVINIADVELRTNIDGVVYFFPEAWGLDEPAYVTTIQDGDDVAGLLLGTDDETVEVTLDSVQAVMPLDVALWVNEPSLRSTVEGISIPGADIRIIENLDELTETPQLIILIAGSSPESVEDYPEFLLDLPGVKIQTLAAAVGLDRETEFIWRQIAQFTGGRFIAYDPLFVLRDLITNLIEEELPR
ncbi:MAG: hypothetical protein L0154_26570 [Chloroflexi bacterium]|nr:hypothetical protein [Chloroflexota bacterium]